MKELDYLLSLLHQKLNEDPTVAGGSALIGSMLREPRLREALQLRLQVVQIVGVIKFLLKLPIENLDVEDKLFARIEDQSNTLQLKPAMTRLFFQTVIAYSKQLQYELFDRLEAGSKADCLKYRNELFELLKKDKPQYLAQWEQLAEPKVLLFDKLQICRELIQQATDHGLQSMGELFNSTRLENQVGFFNVGQQDDAKKSSQYEHFLPLCSSFA